MSDIPLLARRSIRIGRPVLVVFGEIVGLGEVFLEAAAVGALHTGDAELRRQGLLASRRPAQVARVAIQVADPISAHGGLLLPTRWKVTDHALVSDVHATLEARPVGSGDSELEARLVHRPLRGMPDRITAARGQDFLGIVAESFSRRLYWAIEARHRQAPGLQGPTTIYGEHHVVRRADDGARLPVEG